MQATIVNDFYFSTVVRRIHDIHLLCSSKATNVKHVKNLVSIGVWVKCYHEMKGMYHTSSFKWEHSLILLLNADLIINGANPSVTPLGNQNVQMVCVHLSRIGSFCKL